MAYAFNDLSDKTFGKLKVVQKTEKRVHGKVVWECLCECGKQHFVYSSRLVSGHTKSCGCSFRKLEENRNYKHGGMWKHKRLYSIWQTMKTRCTNPNSENYERYGARGISICEEWMSDFEAFRDWALSSGYANHLTLDRLDNDKGYSPDNCRWATWSEQRLNQRRQKGGKNQCHITRNTKTNTTEPVCSAMQI